MIRRGWRCRLFCCRSALSPTFSITTSPHFASRKQGQSIYFIPLCIKPQICEREKIFFSFFCRFFRFFCFSSSTGRSDLFGSGPFSDIWSKPIPIDEVTSSIGHGYNICSTFKQITVTRSSSSFLCRHHQV